MATIYEVLKEKQKIGYGPADLKKHLNSKTGYLKPPTTKSEEELTREKFKRLMGDTGPRQFLKEKGMSRN